MSFLNRWILFQGWSPWCQVPLGHVLDSVEDLDPSTWVIFIGDNGTIPRAIENLYLTSNGRGKRTGYESGSRVPIIIRGPGVAAGVQNDEFIHQADLFATTMELAGLAVLVTNYDHNGSVVTTDSVSLVPLILGDENTLRDSDQDYILTEVATNNRNHFVAARNETYKVLCIDSTANSEFYDLLLDPLEESPLSNPSSCVNNQSVWTPEDSEWHFCKLHEVIESESVL